MTGKKLGKGFAETAFEVTGQGGKKAPFGGVFQLPKNT
jgi:hypothetical protein